MFVQIVNEIENSLKTGDFKGSIDRMRDWLSLAQPGDPARLLEACSPAMRKHVTVLMRDLLSRYPCTLLGCPVMVYATLERTGLAPHSGGRDLPYPRPECAKPNADLHFIGWVPADAQLPIPMPFKPTQHTKPLAWDVPTAVVALFRTHAAVVDIEALEVSPLWWGELFMGTYGNIYMESQPLMAYPDAIDTATALQAGSRGLPGPLHGLFRSELSGAYDHGIVFAENCRERSPH